ncbi:MAG: hypothetical protein A3F83_14070 [Candidatus Glassbacteria bacterium RIFCSPLOWO2_12_FULL_58_11]|uniref:Uncharacterized protein n=1 Tax=Candidatus Glassbacteria bacterium RIFCSPLOWO2_12_FULL_58_11 TaxID=1817867 RepID=A0A1F5Z4X1_9BACT|nr:MAG: hypothetical protein A3F83_14070 [Candidatus Glassbacteria bacterium RIFCSPLOWO2_12_FULL_58_11]
MVTKVKKIEDMIPENKRLNAKLIIEKFENLLETYINKFDREFPVKYENAREIFLLFAYIAKNTYKAVRCLCIDVHPPHWLKPEYAVSTAPMLRMLLEELATVVYFSDDVNVKCERYLKAGWREKKENYDKYFTEFGGMAEWNDWLDVMKKYLDDTKKSHKISMEEEKDLTKIPTWRTIGKMSNDIALSSDLREYLKYLVAWFYKQYSQSAHLTEPGIVHLGAMFLYADPEDRQEVAKKLRSDSIMDCILICLSILSEFEIIFQYEQKERLKYLWSILVKYYPKANELYQIRYSAIL